LRKLLEILISRKTIGCAEVLTLPLHFGEVGRCGPCSDAFLTPNQPSLDLGASLRLMGTASDWGNQEIHPVDPGAVGRVISLYVCFASFAWEKLPMRFSGLFLFFIDVPWARHRW
jgi:hypothetical protein